MYEYNAVITNVVDGDTFDMEIDLGFHVKVKERVRLLGIDTPECRGDEEKRAGLAVANWAKKKFADLKVKIKSEKGTDSFGRWLVYVVLPDGVGLIEYYYRLGINKWADNYNEENCYALEKYSFENKSDIWTLNVPKDMMDYNFTLAEAEAGLAKFAEKMENRKNRDVK